MSLLPLPTVPPEALPAAQRLLVRDAAWGSMVGSFSGGVVLVAFALSLGATPLQIGLLAAIPFMAQAAQLPATVFIEKVRQRRRISVVSITMGRLLIGLLAATPFLASPSVALTVLIAAQVVIAVLHAVGGCAVNSWLHQLIRPEQLGGFFAKRLFWGTALSCAATLAAGYLVERLKLVEGQQPYAWAFVVAAAVGLVSSWYLARAPEPRMLNAGPAVTIRARLLAPVRDRNFRHLLIFMGAWTVAANLAAPFLAVYLMRQLGYPLTTVTALWVASQIANALTLYSWGRLSDRFSNKAILAVALPAYFACTLGLVFTDSADSPAMRLSLLALIHIVMGVASGGIGLATGNIGLKLAPQGHGTSYLAAIGLVTAVTGGTAPIVAGALAQAFQAAELSAVVRWALPNGSGEMAVVQFAHWEFLFALAALSGLYVMHALSRVEEGDEVSERLVIQEFALEAVRSAGNGLSSVGGALSALFPFERLTERRRFWRPHLKPGSA